VHPSAEAIEPLLSGLAIAAGGFKHLDKSEFLLDPYPSPLGDSNARQPDLYPVAKFPPEGPCSTTIRQSVAVVKRARRWIESKATAKALDTSSTSRVWNIANFSKIALHMLVTMALLDDRSQNTTDPGGNVCEMSSQSVGIVPVPFRLSLHESVLVELSVSSNTLAAICPTPNT
jgi:hypothetical protein